MEAQAFKAMVQFYSSADGGAAPAAGAAPLADGVPSLATSRLDTAETAERSAKRSSVKLPLCRARPDSSIGKAMGKAALAAAAANAAVGVIKAESGHLRICDGF